MWSVDNDFKLQEIVKLNSVKIMTQSCPIMWNTAL